MSCGYVTETKMENPGGWLGRGFFLLLHYLIVAGWT